MSSSKNSRWLVLALLALAQFMVILDTSIVNVALPAIEKALHFAPASLQWIVTAYTLAFGGFLLLGGRAADLYGRRKMFLIGVIGFTVASLLVGFAQSSGAMIVLRGIQGLAAAFMSPAALSIVLTTFQEGEDRNKALSIWGAVAAGGAAAGLLFGGLLTQYLGWRWDFFVNLPVGILVVLGTLRYVPTHASESKDANLDLPGAVLVTSGLMLLVYGLVKAPANGWTSTSTLGMMGGAAILLIGFIINEARAKHPLMPLGIFRHGNVAAANLTQLPITASLFAMFFFLSLYVQQILGYSPIKSGLAFLPVTIIIGFTATQAGKLVGKIGFKPILIASPLFLAGGLLYLAGVPVNGDYFTDILPGLALMAFGLGLSFVSITIAATSGVAPDKSGLASGLLNTSQQIGGALGLAILSGVAADKTTAALVGQIPTKLAIASATVEGFHAAFYTGVGFAVAASLVALVFIKRHRGDHVDATAPVTAL